MKEIVEEAMECLSCKIPKCVEGCPINNRIPEFIAMVKENKMEEAYKIIRDVNPLGAICGRVCPHEKQCQGNCIKGIKGEPVSIGKLESYVCDYALKNNIKIKYDIKENNIKVAIIGSGPAGIACAVELRKLGYDVTIFEKENYLGGILMYGIPEYRLPKDIVKSVIDDLLDMGIKVKLKSKLVSEKFLSREELENTSLNCKSEIIENESLNSENIIAKNLENKPFDSKKIINTKVSVKDINNSNMNLITIDSLFETGYEAIFLGIGAEVSNILPIEGNDLIGVYGANEYLKNERDCKNKKIIVVGGGNVAMDSARVSKREGADVTIIYRRQKADMPANKQEIIEAENEKINFVFGTNIIKIEKSDDGKLIAKCDTGKTYEADNIVMAVGAKLNMNYIDERIKINEQGLIEVNENYETSIKNVFAGGDIVQKKATVCMAIKNGKESAKEIENIIKAHKKIT